MLRKIFTLFFCFLFHFSSNAQLQVDTIHFDGLKKTQAEFLKRLIQSKTDQKTTLQTLDQDLQTIRRQAGIASAELKIDSSFQKININFLIEERITILPILDLGGLKDNYWFSLGILENNLQGRGNALLGFYQNNNGRHGGQLYIRRAFSENLNWAFSANLRRWSSIEPLFFPEGGVNFIYDNNSFGGTLIRKLNSTDQFESGFTVFNEVYQKSSEQNLDNPPGPERLSLNKVLHLAKFEFNRIRYEHFYRRGHYFKIQNQLVYGFASKDLFNSFQMEGIAFFKPLRKVNIAARARVGISTNNETPFAPFVADSQFNIRGIGNRIDRGTAQIVFNIEMRLSAIQTNQLASQLVLFSDSGTWRSPGGTFKDLTDGDLFRQFVGFGFRLIYPKIFGAVLRVDYGIDILNNSERGLVIGWGQYF